MRVFIHDLYAPLNHKSALGDDLGRPGVASWVPPFDQRRLAAYRILAAYRDNVARQYLPSTLPDDAIDKYREYGHAGLLVQSARAACLGDEQTLTVVGSDAEGDTAEGETPTVPVAAAALSWLQQWARKERLSLRLQEAEEDAVCLGDAVYTLGWDVEKKRPRLRIYDPGFYFPVLTGDQDADEFPGRHHIAWETELDDGTVELHRLTWSLGPIRPLTDPAAAFDEIPSPAFDPGTGRPVLRNGDRVDTEGRIVRDYAWNTTPSRTTCYFTHAVWRLRDVTGNLFNLDPATARYPIGPDGQPQRDIDLKLDFVPVVHVPNDAAGRRHFGRSILLMVAQVLDDLSGADTDLQESSALVGSATMVTKGGPAGDLDVGPGSRLDLPVGADASYLDTSRNLDALLKYKGSLEKTLSVNSRLSDALLGRVDASNAVAALAITLSFGPTENLVREMRLSRAEKYPLLLKFALRMAQAAGQLAAGATPDASIEFGPFLPADRAQAVEQVTKALAENAMSRSTAVHVLMAAGFPIEDAQSEVERIGHEDFTGASELLDALGDEQAVADYLGRKLPGAAAAGGGGEGS
jgi:hypothetical protein